MITLQLSTNHDPFLDLLRSRLRCWRLWGTPPKRSGLTSPVTSWEGRQFASCFEQLHHGQNTTLLEQYGMREKEKGTCLLDQFVFADSRSKQFCASKDA